MRTGKCGRTAIAWAQTELDGLEAAPLGHLVVGAAWSWRGRGVDLIGVEALDLEQAVIPRSVSLLSDRIHTKAIEDARNLCGSLEISNGAQRFDADLVWVESEELPVLIFQNGCPEREQDYWVSRVTELSDAVAQTHIANDIVVVFPSRWAASDRDAGIEQLQVLTAAE